jgi:glycerophosphoryl diester phosphodiesterase
LKVPDIELEVVKLVKEYDMMSDVIFSSFLHATLGVIRAHSGNAVTAVLINEQMEDAVKYAQNLSADAINPLFFTLSPDLVAAAHEAGLKIYPWTVNEPEFIKEMLRMGVDGIITDFPDIAVDVVDSLIISGEL